MVGHDVVSITTAVLRASLDVISNHDWIFGKISECSALFKQMKTIPQLVLPADSNRQSPEALIIDGAAFRGISIGQSRISECVEMSVSPRFPRGKHHSEKQKDEDEDALKPEHGNQHRFQADDNLSG